jgi:hypothetical protein
MTLTSIAHQMSDLDLGLISTVDPFPCILGLPGLSGPLSSLCYQVIEVSNHRRLRLQHFNTTDFRYLISDTDPCLHVPTTRSIGLLSHQTPITSALQKYFSHSFDMQYNLVGEVVFHVDSFRLYWMTCICYIIIYSIPIWISC